MTPERMARNLAQSKEYGHRVLGVAMITRGLTDDDPATFRQGWPLNESTVARAAEYVGVDPTEELVIDVLALAPTLSDAILNKGA